MLTKGAVEDLIMRHLTADAGVPPRPGAGPRVPGRQVPVRKVFLSDWELRRIYKPGAKTVQVPANAILSPLSIDWIDYNGITVLRV